MKWSTAATMPSAVSVRNANNIIWAAITIIWPVLGRAQAAGGGR